MVKIWTAQYNYRGADRIDITTRQTHEHGKAFAPTWDLVKRYRDGEINNRQYSAEYVLLMRKSWVEKNWSWEWLLNQDEVTLVCFCKPGAFCHRTVLAHDILGMNFKNAQYMGEREV